MSAVEWNVRVGGDTTRAEFEPAENGNDAALFVCGHGAGGNLNDRGVLATANAMRANGLGVVRFNFLYKEKKSGRPDPMPKLTDTFAHVVAAVQDKLRPKALVIGGRSMGGRAASMLAAEGFNADGLLLLAYPLHPPGQPEKLRDAHLPRITMPVLCLNGTRDPFCTPPLMNAAVRAVTTDWQMEWIEGADHSFHVLRSSGRTDAGVMADIGRTTRAWLDRVLTPPGTRATL